MDRSLTDWIEHLAAHFLSPSSTCETYVPHSHQNVERSLLILGHLGQVTQNSFPPQTSVHLPTPTAPQLTVPTVRNKEYRQALKDKEVLQALLELKNLPQTRKSRSPR